MLGDSHARLIRLIGRGKERSAQSAARFTSAGTTAGCVGSAICLPGRWRTSTIKDVAEELRLEWHTVKELDKHYMREQLRRIGTPGPKIIGLR